MLLADTGAGASDCPFELVLRKRDCQSFGKRPLHDVKLSGAYRGWHPVCLVFVEIASFGLKLKVPAVGVPTPPKGFDGIAGFRFLSRFTYGNFGDPRQFGLEM